MKIAILSMQRIVNFGSVLQAWSLREMIRDAVGEEAEFIDIEDQPALKSKKTVTGKEDYAAAASYPPGLLQRAKRFLITKLSAYNKRKIRAFMCGELRLNAENNAKAYDCAVVGSDEMFNHSRDIRLQTHGEIHQAQRVISYAASCGTAMTADIEAQDLPRVRQAMAHFSALSVRDEGTLRYAQALYDLPVEKHMDPVLMGPLHQRKARAVPLKKYLLVYAYGQRIRTKEEIGAICDFARANGLKTVAVGGSQFWCDLYLPLSPMRLLDYFRHAEYVVTDTFHGVIFSVINRRKFAVIIRQSNENKLVCLLNDLGLPGRRVKDMKDLSGVLSEEIDYDSVDAILTAERMRAREYLREQLVK